MTTRPTISKPDQVQALLSKTLENGATEGEERVSVVKAQQLIHQFGLEIGDFVFPARYRVVGEGASSMVVPAEVVVERVVRDRTSTGKTIVSLCEGMIAAGESMDAILRTVAEEFPGCQTSKGCVSWYKARMVREGRLAKGSPGGTRGRSASKGAQAQARERAEDLYEGGGDENLRSEEQGDYESAFEATA